MIKFPPSRVRKGIKCLGTPRGGGGMLKLRFDWYITFTTLANQPCLQKVLEFEGGTPTDTHSPLPSGECEDYWLHQMLCEAKKIRTDDSFIQTKLGYALLYSHDQVGIFKSTTVNNRSQLACFCHNLKAWNCNKTS